MNNIRSYLLIQYKNICIFVDLLLLFTILLSLAGCQLFRPDGEVDLNQPEVFVGVGTISDIETPGLLYTLTTENVKSVVEGMA
jgi:hypothetical protein